MDSVTTGATNRYDRNPVRSAPPTPGGTPSATDRGLT